MRRGLALVFVLCLAPSTALGQGDGDATDDGSEAAEAPSAEESLDEETLAEFREFWRHGIALLDQDQWADALVEFERARLLLEHPALLGNIAVAQASLGRHREAIVTLERMREIADPALHAAIDVELERSRAHLATLSVAVTPANAELFIDGRLEPSEGETREILLNPGPHTIELRATEHRAHRSEVRLTAHESTVIEIALEPDPTPVAETPALPPASPVREPADLATPGWGLLIAGGGLALIGGAIAIAGGVFYVDVDNASGARWDDYAERYDNAQWMIPVGSIGGALGLALIGVGAALLVLPADDVEIRASLGGVSLRTVF